MFVDYFGFFRGVCSGTLRVLRYKQVTLQTLEKEAKVYMVCVLENKRVILKMNLHLNYGM